VLTLAADHIVLDTDLFHSHIVTFGLIPSEPRTSYGYIRRGAALGFDGVNAVGAFIEKPDPVAATRYVAEGYLWNSGNFLFGAEELLSEPASSGSR
jgi:mannose-1-phosphate guanylyltransferase / mannose-6-phosphate isomerase